MTSVCLCTWLAMDNTSSSSITVNVTDSLLAVSTPSSSAVGSSGVPYRLSQEEITQIATAVAGIIHPPSTSVSTNPLLSGREASVAAASTQATSTSATTGNAG